MAGFFSYIVVMHDKGLPPQMLPGLAHNFGHQTLCVARALALPRGRSRALLTP